MLPIRAVLRRKSFARFCTPSVVGKVKNFIVNRFHATSIFGGADGGGKYSERGNLRVTLSGFTDVLCVSWDIGFDCSIKIKTLADFV